MLIKPLRLTIEFSRRVQKQKLPSEPPPLTQKSGRSTRLGGGQTRGVWGDVRGPAGWSSWAAAGRPGQRLQCIWLHNVKFVTGV